LGTMTSNMNTLYRAIFKMEGRLKALPDFAELDERLQIQRGMEIFKEIDQSSQAASRRLQDILSAMKNFVGLDQAERKAIDVNEALETTRTLLQHKLGSRIRMVTSCADLPRLVASPGRLHQVFMNLLLNAIQAIEGDGEVKICSECRGKELRITIEDDGKGMTPEQLSHVFDPGFTGKGGRIGAGLGLAITRQIVEEHHGDIRIESEPGAGTKVILSLPLEAGVQAEGNETPPAIRAGGKKPASVG
ncbi:MAG: HAMP domain-containing sensor histidine kinase, partial [Acidobacteriota bacterium]